MRPVAWRHPDARCNANAERRFAMNQNDMRFGGQTARRCLFRMQAAVGCEIGFEHSTSRKVREPGDGGTRKPGDEAVLGKRLPPLVGRGGRECNQAGEAPGTTGGGYTPT